MSFVFEKLVGAGNDFVFILEKDLPTNTERPTMVAKACQRNFGIGADGVAIIKEVDLSSHHFQWDFYNSDGSSAEMCGNAARCAVRFIANHYNISDCLIETAAGAVCGKIDDDKIEVSWELHSDKMVEVNVDLENFKTFQGFYINTGVPHFVIANSTREVTPEDCLEIQRHPRFGQSQTNVTLLETSDQGVNLTKTFERGVKGFTLACGTGVIASAFVLQKEHRQDEYFLQAPGGDLSVQLNGAKVTLRGPADLVFTGTYKAKEL